MEDSGDTLTFISVSRASQSLVTAWLQKPHITPYFHGEGLQNTLKDLEVYVSGGNALYHHWLAVADGIPFGYLMTSVVDPKAEDSSRFAQHMAANETAITLDILIGDERYLGKGLAQAMIRQLLLKQFPTIDLVFIDPEVTNARAIHVYEKVGFRKQQQFIAEWNRVPHWLMTLRTTTDLSPPSPPFFRPSL